MTNNDPIAEARRVLAKLKGSKGWVNTYIADELSEALNNLLSHVERLTAPVTGDRAELVCWHNMVARTQRSNDWAPHAGEIAEKHERTAAMLEADARREAALAEAIREIEALFKRQWADESYRQGYNDCHEDVIAILAKVIAEGVDDVPTSVNVGPYDLYRDAGRPDGGER